MRETIAEIKKKIHFPDKFDKDLWYEEQCQHDEVWHKHYIVGNAHTFPGRVHVYCTAQKEYTVESLCGMDRISPKAKIWMQGFLHGNQPSWPADEEGDQLDWEHPETVDFVQRLKRYYKHGVFRSKDVKRRKVSSKKPLTIFVYHEYDQETHRHKIQQLVEDGHFIGSELLFVGNSHFYDACPKGYELEWVNEPEKDERVQKAIEIARSTGQMETLKEKFERLAQKWRDNLPPSSDPGVLMSTPEYKEIERLGWNALPFIMEDLNRTGAFWFEALRKICNYDPVKKSSYGSVEKMIADWNEYLEGLF